MDEYLFPPQDPPPADPDTLDLFAPSVLCAKCKASEVRDGDTLCDECAAIVDDRVTDWHDSPSDISPPASKPRPAA